MSAVSTLPSSSPPFSHFPCRSLTPQPPIVSPNCSTPFWDPIKGECICTSSTCAFTDTSRPIGPNGANLTGNQINSTDSSSSTQTTDPYVPFNGAVQLPAGVSTALLVGVVGAFIGALGAVARL